MTFLRENVLTFLLKGNENMNNYSKNLSLRYIKDDIFKLWMIDFAIVNSKNINHSSMQENMQDICKMIDIFLII